MKKILIILFLFLSTIIYANNYQSPMSVYRDNFFILGNKEDQIKFQISAKYNILWPFDSGIYLGYTQLTHWWVYGSRDTMNTNFQPEVFFRFTSGSNIFNDFEIPYVDYIQVAPIYHCSTGVEGENHRAVNEYYGQIQMSVGEVYNIGFNLKVFNYYSICNKNKDINDYQKNYQTDLFFKIKSSNIKELDKEELHCIFGGNPLNKGYVEIKVIARLLTTYIQPRIFFDYYKGYNQFMTTYNQKETSYRIGLVFLE